MVISGSRLQAKHSALALMAGAAAVVALSACDAPFNLGQPSTRALENGAAGTLTAATSFEIIGSYSESGDPWSIDLQVVRPATQHVTVSKADLKLEAIIFKDPAGSGPTDAAYFRGNQYLSQHMGSDPNSRNLVKAAGNAWWKGPTGGVPRLPDFTDGSSFRATFLGPAVAQRFDHVSMDGVDAVNLSGPRADVFVATAPPYRLLRVRMKKGAAVDGIMTPTSSSATSVETFKSQFPPTLSISPISRLCLPFTRWCPSTHRNARLPVSSQHCSRTWAESSTRGRLPRSCSTWSMRLPSKPSVAARRRSSPTLGTTPRPPFPAPSAHSAGRSMPR